MKSGIVIELSMLLHKKLVSLVSKYLEDYARFLYRVWLNKQSPTADVIL